MKPIAHYLIRCLLACSLLPAIAGAAAYSDPLGIIRLELTGGGALNVVSNPFLPQAVMRSQVTGVAGTDVTIAATPSIPLAGTHYLEVTSGAGEGSMTDIVSVVGNTLETADDWSSFLAVDDTIVVREIPTLHSIFGEDNKFGFKARTTAEDLGDYDLLYFFNPSDQTLVKVFYADVDGFVGWVESVDFTLVNPKLYPETAFLAEVRGTDVSLTMVGEVTQNAPNVAVFPGVNFISIFNPLSGVSGIDPNRVITLETSGLYSGDPASGIIPYDGVSRNDVVLLPSSDTAGAFDSFFYFDDPEGLISGWYDTVEFAKVENRVLETGTSVIVMRYLPGATEFAWLQPNLHIPTP